MAEGFDVWGALRSRHDAVDANGSAWAYFEEVRNSTGYSRVTRSADAIAMSLWPSRGLELHGYEVKVSRSDWLRELKDAAKADEIFKMCDRWWLVVNDASIVQPGELPAPWGLLVPKGRKLIAAKEAPKLEPATLTRGFLAALLRKVATDTVPASRVTAMADAKFQAERERWQDGRVAEREAAERNLELQQKMLDDFERASGVRISLYDGPRIGEAVRQVLRSGTGRDRAQALRRDAERYAELAEELKLAADELAAVEQTVANVG